MSTTLARKITGRSQVASTRDSQKRDVRATRLTRRPVGVGVTGASSTAMETQSPEGAGPGGAEP